MVKIADCTVERMDALRLVYDKYHTSKLVDENTLGIRVLPQHLSNQTDIIIGKDLERIIFTASLIKENKFGFPVQSLFADKVKELQNSNLKLAEISCLAQLNNSLDTLVQGISYLVQFAKMQGLDCLLFGVHPKHSKVYERLFGCNTISDVRSYASVNNNPAVLCIHDLNKTTKETCLFYEKIYNVEWDYDQMKSSSMTKSEKMSLMKFVDAKFSSI